MDHLAGGYNYIHTQKKGIWLKARLVGLFPAFRDLERQTSPWRPRKAWARVRLRPAAGHLATRRWPPCDPSPALATLPLGRMARLTAEEDAAHLADLQRMEVEDCAVDHLLDQMDYEEESYSLINVSKCKTFPKLFNTSPRFEKRFLRPVNPF